MANRIRAIKNCYFDLRYKGNKQKALKEISNLTEEITIGNVKNILERLLETISIIEKNLSLFQSIFKHIDTVSTIIQFLQHFGNTKRVACKAIDEFDEPLLSDIMDALYTLFYICPDREMQLFLHTAIIKDSARDDSSYKVIYEDNYKQLFSCQTIDMIIFKDADLYAVVNQLKITRTRMNNIWVQKSVLKQFSWLLNKYFKQSFNHYIHEFQIREELLTPKETNKMSILSIWSEDVTGAKKLAVSLKKDVIFINTHMDFCGGLVFLPYTRLLQDPMHQFLLSKLDLYDDTSETDKKTSKNIQKTCNLFYNGTWQKPVKGNYWIHDNCLWANATIKDTKKCIQSAEQGFKIWSNWSVESKIQILSKFASILKDDGKLALSNLTFDLIKYAYFPELSLQCLQIGRLEVKITYMPRGIIIIEYTNDLELLQNLIVSLVYGNSVIIICNSYSTLTVKYCDMFSRSEIPPGVINMLLGKNMLCPNNNVMYICKIRGIIAHFTREKKVILPLE